MPSEFQDLQSWLLARADAQVSGLATQVGYKTLSQVAEYPFAMCFDPAEATVAESGAPFLKTRSVVLTMAVYWSGDDQATVTLAADAIRDEIETDPTAGGLVRRLWVSERVVDEHRDDARKAVIFQVTAETHL